MRTLKILIPLFIALFISGCAGFQSNKLPPLDDYEINVSESDKSSLFFSIRNVEGSSIILSEQAFRTVWGSEIKDYIIATGCCVLTDDSSKADASVYIDAVNHANASVMIPAFITGASLWTIPSWVTQKADLEVSIENRDGRIQNYDIQDSAVYVQWLPMIFAYPFQGGPINARQELLERVSRNIVKNLYDDGFLIR